MRANEPSEKTRCPSCGERHSPKVTCLEAWLEGLKSPENNGNKAPRTRETISRSWKARLPRHSSVNDAEIG